MTLEFKIGATSGALVYAETTIGLLSKSEFIRWPVRYDTVNGQEYGDGLPVMRWTFAMLTETALAALLVYLTTGGSYVTSKTCAIKTRIDDGTYKTYDCIIHWPEGLEGKRNEIDQYWGVTVEFTHLEVVA